MKTKAIVTLTLALSLLLTGAFTTGSTYATEANNGIMLIHDGHNNNRLPL